MFQQQRAVIFIMAAFGTAILAADSGGQRLERRTGSPRSTETANVMSVSAVSYGSAVGGSLRCGMLDERSGPT